MLVPDDSSLMTNKQKKEAERFVHPASNISIDNDYKYAQRHKAMALNEVNYKTKRGIVSGTFENRQRRKQLC